MRFHVHCSKTLVLSVESLRTELVLEIKTNLFHTVQKQGILTEYLLPLERQTLCSQALEGCTMLSTRLEQFLLLLKLMWAEFQYARFKTLNFELLLCLQSCDYLTACAQAFNASTREQWQVIRKE